MSERELFTAALHLGNPAARAAFLDQACGADKSLRNRVDSLLREHEKLDSFLEAPAAGEVPTAATATFGVASAAATAHFPGKDEHLGAVLGGKYKLMEEIGDGGMGSVYMALQTEPVKRAVAVKVIKAGMDSKAVLARFEAERQALAMMDHPNIAKVLDAGTTESGRPFFVMELVKGTPITGFCDERKFTPRQRLELMIPVCQAIQHAHQKGIIHRDIKPSNVLVAMYDDRPVPKVIDFGVAKAAGQSLTDKTLMTGFGAVVGTPEYMSPEQANLNNLDIDTRSDVYSLGVLLYELLTGSTPVDRKSLGKAAILEILRIVREVEAPRPSAKLSTIDTLASVAANRGTDPAKLSRLMKGELDWVVLKALEKDRTRRYETANGLARDIQRYLADEVVEARPPSTGYRLRKFVRRNPLQLALAGMAALLLLGGGSVVLWQNEQAGARRETELRRQLLDEQRAAADNARLARNAEAVASLLGQAEEALKADDTAKAAVVLEAARKRSAEGGAEEQAERLGRLDADLALLRDLDAVDQFRWTIVENKLADPAAVAIRTRDALRRFGADPDVAPADEAAARVSASVVRERIVSALDRLLLPIRLVDVEKQTANDRKLYTPQLLADVAAQLPKTPSVGALLRLVDAHPYRDAIRDAILAGDRAKFVELATQKTAEEQPPGFVAFLGGSKAIPIERRRQFLEVAVRRRSGNLDLLMTLGFSYIDQKDDENERLRWFQAAVAIAPGNSAALNELGGVLCNYKKDYDGAIACIQKAVALDPNHVNAHIGLGNARFGKGQLDEALVCYQKAIALDPKSGQARIGMGNILREKKNLVGAEAAYRQAIRLDPQSSAAHHNLGIVLSDKKDLAGAEAAYRQAIRLDPQSSVAHHNLGIVLSDKKDLAGAEAAYREAIRLDPKYAQAHYNLGNILLDRKDLTGAEAAFREALRLNPKYVPAHSHLGLVLMDKKDLAGAEAAYREAIRLDPKYALAHGNLGTVLRDKNDLAGAESAFREALRLDPKLALAHFCIGNVLWDKKDSIGAEAAFREALRLNPKLVQARTKIVQVLNARGDHKGVIALYREWIDLDRTDPQLHANLGGALTNAGDLPGAIASFREATRLDPNHAGAHNGLGRVLTLTKDVDGEISSFREAVRINPKFVEAQFRLGTVLMEKKDASGAAAAFLEVIRLDPKIAAAHNQRVVALAQAGRPAEGLRELLATLGQNPTWAGEPQNMLQYNAACLAMNCADGKGSDVPPPAERPGYRKQALDFLTTDLAAMRKLVATDRLFVFRRMQEWLADDDLASARDPKQLATLPEVERQEWEKLWSEVRALRDATGPSEKAPKP